MKAIHIKAVDKLREDRLEEFVAWKNIEIGSQKTFGRERNEAMSQATLRTAERDSANDRYHEVLAALRRIAEVQKKRKILQRILS